MFELISKSHSENKELNLIHRYASFLDIHFRMVLAVTLFVSALAGSGLYLKRQSLENNQERLVSPFNGPAILEKAIITEKWPIKTNRFILSSAFDALSMSCQLLVTLKSKANILNHETLQYLTEWNEHVLNKLESLDPILSKRVKYHDICLRFESSCATKNSILGALEYFYSDQALKAISLSFPKWNVHGSNRDIFIGDLIGGVEFKHANSSVVRSATAIRLTYFVQTEGPSVAAWKWQQAYQEFVKKSFINNASSIFDVAYAHSKSMDYAVADDNEIAIAPKIGMSAILIGVVAFALSLRIRRVRSTYEFDFQKTKNFLIIVAILTPSLAVTVATGLWLYCGGSYVGSMDIIPFLIMGIGLDDSFILLTAWGNSEDNGGYLRRTKETLRSSLFPITMTTLTTCICFTAGALSADTFVILSFCQIAALTVAIDFLLQLFLFGTCLFLSGVIEHQGMVSVPLYFFDQSSNKGSWGDVMNGMTHKIRKGRPLSRNFVQETRIPGKPNIIIAKYVTFLKTSCGLALTFLIHSIYLTIAVAGLLHIKEGMDTERLGPTGHHMNKYYKFLNKYFYTVGQRVDIVVNKAPNMTRMSEREKLQKFVKVLEESPVSNGRNSTSFFLRDFEKYVMTSGYHFHADSDKWESVLLQWSRLSNERMMAENNLVWQRIVRNGTSVAYLAAFRFQIGLSHFETTVDQQSACNQLRVLVSQFPEYNVTTYHHEWRWVDQYNIVRKITLLSIFLTIACMVALAAVFFRSLYCTICTFLSVLSINLGILGYMAFMGVRLDLTADVVIVMSIGFSIDYIYHIIHGFTLARGTDAERIASSIYNLGFPIFQGALTTFIGVLPLALVDSYIPYVFFAITMLSILFGVYHAFIIVPFMLCYSDIFDQKLGLMFKKLCMK